MGKQKPNEYQRVVAIVHRLFRPVNARVTLAAEETVRPEEGGEISIFSANMVLNYYQHGLL